MKLLQKQDYGRVLEELDTVTINQLFARSVIKQHVDGDVFVDDIAHPTGFYVVHPCGMSLLFGSGAYGFLNNGLMNYLLGSNGLRKRKEWMQVFPSEHGDDIDSLFGVNMVRNDVVDDSLQGNGASVIRHRRINFRFDTRRFEAYKETIDFSGFSFCTIDTDVYHTLAGVVVPDEFWNTASDFVANGSGICLKQDERLIAHAFSSFKHGRMFELGMETQPEFRRRGLAGVICAKLIDDCLNSGFEPAWSCREGNAGSFYLAVKLGFEPTAWLPYYEFI